MKKQGIQNKVKGCAKIKINGIFMLGTTKGLIKSRQVTKLVTVGLNLVKQY
jgi:hypothetical protein